MTDQELDAYLALLQQQGWRIEFRADGGVMLDESLRRRHSRIPEDYLKFLQKVSLCVNAAETVWYLCADDYNGTSKWAWAWNELEKMELEGAEDDERAAIVEFWNRHLPFMYSTHSDYAYLAFRVMDESFGSVVEGYDIDLREPTDAAPSFEEFIRLHSAALKGEGEELLQNYYV